LSEEIAVQVISCRG